MGLLDLLAAQMTWLSEEFFSTELPEAEGWFEPLIARDLWEGLKGVVGEAGWEGLERKWEGLREVVGRKFGWVVGELRGGNTDADEDEEEDEDEEDRPVVVDVAEEPGYEIQFVY